MKASGNARARVTAQPNTSGTLATSIATSASCVAAATFTRWPIHHSRARPAMGSSIQGMGCGCNGSSSPRLRQISHARVKAEHVPSTGALPKADSAAISRSASGLRNANIAACRVSSMASGPPCSSREVLNPAHSQATPNRQAASSTSDADSGRRGSINAAA